MKSILSFNGNTASIQGYQEFFAMRIYTILCNLLINYFQFVNKQMPNAYCIFTWKRRSFTWVGFDIYSQMT